MTNIYFVRVNIVANLFLFPFLFFYSPERNAPEEVTNYRG